MAVALGSHEMIRSAESEIEIAKSAAKIVNEKIDTINAIVEKASTASGNQTSVLRALIYSAHTTANEAADVAHSESICKL